MKTFQSITTFEKDNEVTQSVDNIFADSPLTEQVEKFSNNYSDAKIRELTNEFDSITIDEEVINSVTLTEDNVLTKEKMSFRYKLFITCSIAITALLLFLAIYNIFRINAMQSGIQMLENNIATETTIYNSLMDDVDSMNDTTNMYSELESKGYYEITNDQMIDVTIAEASNVATVSGSTNWFDSICNFISSVFGG